MTEEQPAYSLEVLAGRLIVARVRALPDVESARRYAAELGRISASVAIASPVLCADHRPVVVYAPEVADELARLFSLMNNVLRRIAILVAPSNATLHMQLSRIIREAQNPSRRLFTEAEGAAHFLAEVLSVSEQRAVRNFLAQFQDDAQ